MKDVVLTVSTLMWVLHNFVLVATESGTGTHGTVRSKPTKLSTHSTSDTTDGKVTPSLLVSREVPVSPDQAL